MTDRSALADLLLDTADSERPALLLRHPTLADRELAEQLHGRFTQHVLSAPDRARAAADSLRSLSTVSRDESVTAFADWTTGLIALILAGEPGQALGHLDAAAEQFAQVDLAVWAARVNVSRVHALALLGRYDEAIANGIVSRDALLDSGDLAGAARIEQNLGNLHKRRDHYPQAEQLYSLARQRLIQIGDDRQLAMVENSLANTLVLQHRFDEARDLYQGALARSIVESMTVTQAEIECNLGCLARFRGEYAVALRLLDQSRRRFEPLGMPLKMALSEQELADAYLDLNLFEEAASTYRLVHDHYAGLGMRSEQAWSLVHLGQALIGQGRFDEAKSVYDQAAPLYLAESNVVGLALVQLGQAEIALASGAFSDAADLASHASIALAGQTNLPRELQARWLEGEARRRAGQLAPAGNLLRQTLTRAKDGQAPLVAARCATSLGLLHRGKGERERAGAAFLAAINQIEQVRTPLPGDQLRTSFFEDKLTPYLEMIRACLESEPPQLAEAVAWSERCRARALLDLLEAGRTSQDVSLSAPDDLHAEATSIATELKWFYEQRQRLDLGLSDQLHQESASVRRAITQREARLLAIASDPGQRGAEAKESADEFELPQFQEWLPADTTVLEYHFVDDDVYVFVISRNRVVCERLPVSKPELEQIVRLTRMQIETFRFGAEALRAKQAELEVRVRRHLTELYDRLIRPIRRLLLGQQLVIIPFHVLHYVPFCALFDGDQYLNHDFAIATSPSLATLQHLRSVPVQHDDRVLLVGYSDDTAPLVHRELDQIRALYAESTVLLGEFATFDAVRAHSPGAGIVHLACHGRFRSDNPLFSAIQLADGWCTVRDLTEARFDGALVILSACETGVNRVAPGDELIGLTRGLMIAGARAIIVSLWPVDDAVTASFMVEFHRQQQAGASPALALRLAQQRTFADHSHPFYWAPFQLIGWGHEISRPANK